MNHISSNLGAGRCDSFASVWDYAVIENNFRQNHDTFISNLLSQYIGSVHEKILIKYLKQYTDIRYTVCTTKTIL